MIPLLAILAAIAEDTGTPPEEESADEELIVFGDLAVQQRRAELGSTLEQMGYREAKRRGDRSIYRPEVAWHPSVVVDDEGFVLIKRSPVRIEPWVDGRSKLTWLSCIPPFTPMCVRIGGQVVSERKLAHKKAWIAYSIDPRVDAWRAAIVAEAMGRRLNEDIPDMLEDIWSEGQPLSSGGDALVEPADRRAALLGFWASRACTPEGLQARQTTASFIRYEVQESPTPVTAEELALANATRYCGDPLTLDGSEPQQ